MPRGLVSEKMTQTHFPLPSAQPLQGAYYSYTGRATTCQERTAFSKIPQSESTKGSACNAGDLGSISESGRSPGGGHGNPLQYSCLENPHGQRSLWPPVHGITESHMTELTKRTYLHGKQQIHPSCFLTYCGRRGQKTDTSWPST